VRKRRTSRARKSKDRSSSWRQALCRQIKRVSHWHVPIGWTLIVIEILLVFMYRPDIKPTPPDWYANPILVSQI